MSFRKNPYREIGDIREQNANNRRIKERFWKLLYPIANRISPYAQGGVRCAIDQDNLFVG